MLPRPQITIKALFQKQAAARSREGDYDPVAQPFMPSLPFEAGVSATAFSGNARPAEAIDAMVAYARKVAQEVVTGARSLRDSPWVLPDDVQAQGAAGSHITVEGHRPKVFVWAPEKMMPCWRLPCPTCKGVTTYSECHAPRVVHTLTSHYMYVCTKHLCYQCSSAQGSTGSAKRPRTKIAADRHDVRQLMPTIMSQHWNIITTGRNLFDVEVLDHVRAMATRTSWSALADGINEMKSTSWARREAHMHAPSCDTASLLHAPAQLPEPLRLCAAWLRKLYMVDATQRREAVSQELEAVCGTELLMMDWTCDAAARCGSQYLFNVMNGDRKIVISKLTKSCGPWEVEPELAKLKQRGARPQVVYVDDQCCGAWKQLIERHWPQAYVRLDVMHAIRRLAQTTASVRHPWHARFCQLLAAAIYTFDPVEKQRLEQAWERTGCGSTVPEHMQRRYVPRAITHPSHIVIALDAAIGEFAHKWHPTAGTLLTAATQPAWDCLRSHVAAGCLCDPPGLELNRYGEVHCIGGESFRTVTSSRGSSQLEGFHEH